MNERNVVGSFIIDTKIDSSNIDKEINELQKNLGKKGSTIDIKANTKEGVKGVGLLDKEVKRGNKSIKEIKPLSRDSFGEIIKQSDKAKSMVDSLGGSFKGAVSTFSGDIFGGAAKSAKKVLDVATNPKMLALGGLVKFGTESVKQGTKFHKFITGNIEKANEALWKFGAESTVDIAKGVGKAYKEVGKKSIEFGRDSFQEFIAFDEKATQAQAIGKYTDEMMSDIKNEVLKVASKTPLDGAEIMDVVIDMSRIGSKPDEIIRDIGSIINFAVANAMDPSEAVSMLVKGSKMFKLPIEEIAGMINKAASSSGTSAEAIKESWGTLASSAQLFKEKPEDMLTWFGLMADASIEGTQAATVYQAMVRDLIAASKEMGGEIDFGGKRMTLVDADGTFKELDTIVGELHHYSKEMSDVELNVALQSIFSGPALKGVNAFFDRTQDGYTLLKGNIKDHKKGQDLMIDQLKASNNLINGQKIAVKDSNGQWRKTDDILKDVYKSLDGLTDKEKRKALATVFDGKVFEELSKNVNATEEDIKELSKTLSVSSLDEQVNIMMSSIQGQIDIIKSSMSAIKLTLGDQISIDTKPLTKDIQGALDEINAIISDYKIDASGFEIGRIIGETLVSSISNVGNTLPAYIKEFTNIFSSSLKGIIDGSADISSGVYQIGKSIAKSFMEVAPLMVQAIRVISLDILREIKDNSDGQVIGQFVTDFITSIASFLLEAAPLLFDISIDIAIGVMDYVIENGDEINDKIGVMIKKMGQVWESRRDEIKERLPQFADIILDLWKDNKGEVNSVLRMISKDVIDDLADSMSKYGELKAQEFGDKVKMKITGLPKSIAAGFKFVFSWLKSGAKGVFSGLENVVKGGLVSIGTFFQDKWDTFYNWLSNLSLWQAGSNIISSLWDGIKSFDLKESVKGLITTPVGWITDFLGIQSPSRLMMGIGENFTEGYYLGIENPIGQVEATTKAMVDASVPDVKDIIPDVIHPEGLDRLGANFSAIAQRDIMVQSNNGDMERYLSIIANNTDTLRDERRLAKKLSGPVSKEIAYNMS